MAIVSTLSNRFKFKRDNKEIDMANDVFKAILMDTAFAFDPDTHALLADVTANQLASGNGYTQNDKALAGVTRLEDDTADRSRTTWTNVTFTASCVSIGPTGSLIVYDDTIAEKTVGGCVDFGTDYTIADGSSLQFQNLALNSN